MKKIFLFASIALGLGLASCAKDAATPSKEQTNTNGGGFTVTATTADTKTSLGTDGKVTWTSSDQILVYFGDMDQGNIGANSATSTGGTGVFSVLSSNGSTASFGGSILATAKTAITGYPATTKGVEVDDIAYPKGMLYAVYPAMTQPFGQPDNTPPYSNATTSAIVTTLTNATNAYSLTFDLPVAQKQDNNNNIAQYLYMWADPVQVYNTAPKDAVINFNFHQILPLLSFPITGVPSGQRVSQVMLSAKTPVNNAGKNTSVFMGRMQFDVRSTGGNFWWSAGNKVSTYYSDFVSVDIANNAPGNMTAQIAVIPHDYMQDNTGALIDAALGSTATRDLVLTITTRDANGTVYTYTADKPATSTYWEPGVRYTVGIPDPGNPGSNTGIDLGLMTKATTPLPSDVHLSGKTITLDDANALVWMQKNMTPEEFGSGFAGFTVELDPVASGGTINLGGTPWTPIGTDANPFKGTFNGNNVKITGLNVTGSGALFGTCQGTASAPATIEEVYLDGAQVTISGTDVGGAGIAANASYVNFSGCTVNNITLSTSVAGSSNYVTLMCGGVVRYADHCTITGCSTSGTMQTTASTTGNPAGVGGICGFMTQSIIKDCSNSATISYTGNNAMSIISNLGGIVAAIDGAGASSSLVMGCKNSGTIKSTTASPAGLGNWRYGGICGLNGGSVTGGVIAFPTLPTPPAIINVGALIVGCYNTGTVQNAFGANGQGGTGGIVGMNNGVVSACYSTGMIDAGAKNTNVGGFIVGNNNGTVEFCYFDQTKSATITGNGLVKVATSSTGAGPVNATYDITVQQPAPSLPGWGTTQPATGWTSAFDTAVGWATPWNMSDTSNPNF